MDKQNILANIERTAKQQVDEAKEYYRTAPEPSEQPQSAEPVDYYQMQENAAYEASQKPTAYGSPAQIGRIVGDMIKEFRQERYNVAMERYKHLIDANAKDQAEYMRQDYMTKNALPLVESLVEVFGVDALLNNKGALSKLDEIMITGNGAGDGYTKGYLKQMHQQQLGTQSSESDAEITYGLSQIAYLADKNDIRGSVTEAKRLKDKVDKGELSASEDDYRMLLQVSSYK